MSIIKTIEDLRLALNEHNYNYYVLDNPTISDYDFDLKLKELQELENKYPEVLTKIHRHIGGMKLKIFETVVHDYRMYSLDNSYSKKI
jgi:DNA ligase (NAD+)